MMYVRIEGRMCDIGTTRNIQSKWYLLRFVILLYTQRTPQTLSTKHETLPG
jgi:hypothetical protein